MLAGNQVTSAAMLGACLFASPTKAKARWQEYWGQQVVPTCVLQLDLTVTMCKPLTAA
jgi:hypothetical protein